MRPEEQAADSAGIKPVAPVQQIVAQAGLAGIRSMQLSHVTPATCGAEP